MPLSIAASAALVALLWAGNFLFTQAALDARMTPLLLIASRFALASSLAFVTPRPAEVGWAALAAVGLGLGIGQFAMATLAMQAGLSPGLTALVLQTQGLLTIGLATVWLGERASLRTVGGAVLALLGIGALASGGSPCRLGLALAVGAAVAAAVLNVVLKRLAPSADPVRVAVWMSPFPVLPLLALSCAVEGSPLTTFGHSDAAVVMPAIAFGGLISTVAGTALWTRLLRRAPASRVAPFTLLVPVFATALSAVIDRKFPAPNAILPFCAVLAGLAVAQGRGAVRLPFSLSRARVGVEA